ncbi:kinase-interacting family protein-like [Cynara cardunculus var. scolymus]|uniref:kinase-interacting family protein-like n=1 Tax=Cynara cardunculus var. scolymus TaxID=59895 RepID=UPI000D62DED7|nr:kinase-interacting family protein-like [Cynara cardunculus var. scolymus]XP_024986205.1 kinase-interacting family protein-like [Cynara cardunculus var. scolymus]XP_024986206.1 kinase-interacting family protein-like [Cynara cardunculus var. scolymus]XP_024986207.1 kinase-interacting family protein-like [Cynara cardunculus var. scolymus]
MMLPVTYSGCNALDGMSSSSSAEQSRRSKSKFITKPSWLLLSISDLEDKIQAINGEEKPDTFGERADFYYRKRPELLALLQELYNRYLYLADRYTRTLSKQQLRHHEVICPPVDDNNNTNADYSDDAESSLSYQPPADTQKPIASELVISELVMRFVEYEIVVDEVQSLDMIQEESKKKIELQKSLLEVLESERVVLTNENSRLASESLFMKRKAGELARCVLLERSEDQRVFVLSRKIDDLQGQIYELEKRNKEYYDKLKKQHESSEGKSGKKNIKRLMVKSNGGGGSSSSISWSGGEDETGCSMSSTSNSSSTCTSLAQVMKEKKHPGGSGKKVYGWWDRVKKFDMFMCGPHLDATCC